MGNLLRGAGGAPVRRLLEIAASCTSDEVRLDVPHGPPLCLRRCGRAAYSVSRQQLRGGCWEDGDQYIDLLLLSPDGESWNVAAVSDGQDTTAAARWELDSGAVTYKSPIQEGELISIASGYLNTWAAELADQGSDRHGAAAS